MLSPADAAKKWAQKLGGAVAEWEAGVNSVTVAPNAKAAAAAQDYLQGVMASVNSGQFAAANNRVSLDQWKTRTRTKGRERLASGATEAIPRMQAYMTESFPVIESIRQRIQSMPGDSYEARKARAVAFMDAMREYGQQRKGR